MDHHVHYSDGPCMSFCSGIGIWLTCLRVRHCKCSRHSKSGCGTASIVPKVDTIKVKTQTFDLTASLSTERGSSACAVVLGERGCGVCSASKFAAVGRGCRGEEAKGKVRRSVSASLCILPILCACNIGDRDLLQELPTRCSASKQCRTARSPCCSP